MNPSAARCLSLVLVLALQSLSAADPVVLTDPAQADRLPEFQLQGEYTAEGRGLQIVSLGEGRYGLVKLTGGLPGAGWNGENPAVERAGAEEVKAAIQGFKKHLRLSPTLGAKPPEGARVLFDGQNTTAWEKAKTEGDLLCEGANTLEDFGDFHLHLEFRMPYKPAAFPGSQDRGNSGVYIFNRYEIQVLDSFGLHYNSGDDWAARFEREWGAKPASDRNQWCGAFYKFKTPDINVSAPPLIWQTYDIDFTAPRFSDGRKTQDARITVVHNGVKIHDNVALPKGTGAGGSRPEVARERIYLQAHANPVRFRNIWLVPKD